jgi:DNA invertase Pin-like site-specific DNA recombinase
LPQSSSASRSTASHAGFLLLSQSGLARAKSEGKRLGRPRIAPELEERIRKALATPGRPGLRKIAERFGVDPGTVQRISRPRHPVGVL